MLRFLKIASLFLWVLLPLAAYGVFITKGLPHGIVSYSFLDNGNKWDPFLERYYTSCSFYGPYGSFTVPARNGKCPWLGFFKAQG